MAFRTFNGNTNSENGWPYVDQGSCTWVTIPGTNPPVSLQIQNGQPLQIMRAFAADFNAEVEPLRDPDSACWTEGNDVATSNHPGGTAMDLNWNSHPFQIPDAGFDSVKLAKVRELLDWYEGTIFWGNDWDSPKDAMHFQMGYNSYLNAHTDDFIKRKIRPDGYSTRRGDAPAVMTVPLMQNGDGTWGSPSPAWDHLIKRESSGNPTIVQQIIDVNSGGNEAEGLFQITPRTWQAHGGTEFAPSPRLATPQQQAIVAARIFTRNPSGSDWGAGLPGREDAAQLAAGLVPAGGTPVQGEDELSAQAEKFIAEIHGALFNAVPSQSIYATPGEPTHWQLHELIKNDDGMIHVTYVETAARLGDPDALQRVARVASGQGAATDPASIARATRVLAEIEAANPEILKAYLARNGAA